MRKIKKQFLFIYLLFISICFLGCASQNVSKEEIYIYAASSLKSVLEEIEIAYEKSNPNIDIILCCDSSGALMTQILEGHTCDIFFSAAQSQMNQLEEKGFLLSETRKNLISNQLVLIKGTTVNSSVTGLENIAQANSIAFASASVPVGNYTRCAMQKIGLLPDNVDSNSIETAQIMDALGGVSISEQSNVSKVLIAVSENACEVGTTYYSDTYGFEDKITVIQFIDTSLTGPVLYPIAMLDTNASREHLVAVEAFYEYATDNSQKELFEKHYFMWYEE